MSPSGYDLRDRVALVTGGGVGIGRAIVQALARAGAKVAIHCHSSRASADELQRQIEAAGGEVVVIQADLAHPQQAAAVVDQTVERFSRLDILVNNAGSVVARSRIEECPLELWQQALAVNLTSAFAVTQRAI